MEDNILFLCESTFETTHEIEIPIILAVKRETLQDELKKSIFICCKEHLMGRKILEDHGKFVFAVKE